MHFSGSLKRTEFVFLLLQFADLDIAPTYIKRTLISPNTVNLQSDESILMRKLIGDVLDQLPINPRLYLLALGSNVVLIPFVVLEIRMDWLRWGNPIPSGSFTVNITCLTRACFNLDLRTVNATIVLLGNTLRANLNARIQVIVNLDFKPQFKV